MNNIKVQREIVANGGPDIGIAGRSENAKSYNAVYDQYLLDGDATKARKTIGNIYGHGEHPSTDPSEDYYDYYENYYDEKIDDGKNNK